MTIPTDDTGNPGTMKQQAQQHCTPVSDDDLLHIAAWLDHRLDEHSAACVEALLATDPELLKTALSLRDSAPEPVPAMDLLHAQALVTALPTSILSWPYWRVALLKGWRELQPIPLAFGATVAALVVACSLWLGAVAALGLGIEDMQAASMLEITQLDFGASTLVSINE